MVKSVKDEYHSRVPPGGWHWKHPETGQEFRASSLVGLFDKARNYCDSNNLPVGSNFEQDIIDCVCEYAPIACSDSNSPSISDQVWSFASAMWSWVKNGAPVLKRQFMLERREICNGHDAVPACSKWRGDAAFGFGKCGECGCVSVKLFLATEKCPLNKWPAEMDHDKLLKLSDFL